MIDNLFGVPAQLIERAKEHAKRTGKVWYVFRFCGSPWYITHDTPDDLGFGKVQKLVGVNEYGVIPL